MSVKVNLRLDAQILAGLHQKKVDVEVLEAEAEAELWLLKNCGIGSGGFLPGNTCARGDLGADVNNAVSALKALEGDEEEALTSSVWRYEKISYDRKLAREKRAS